MVAAGSTSWSRASRAVRRARKTSANCWCEGEPGRWDVLSETLMIFAARADHVAKTIRPALARGAIVLCDRFTDSTYAYQGAGRGMPRETIRRIESIALPDLKPDLTFMLDLPAEEGLKRASVRRHGETRFEKFDVAFHERLREAFRDIAQAKHGALRRDRCDASHGCSRGRDLARGGSALFDGGSEIMAPRRPKVEEPAVETDRIAGQLHPREVFRLTGQDAALGRASRAIRSGRPPQAWLIGGPPGIGKATLAYRIARYLLRYGATDQGPEDLERRRERSRLCAGQIRRASRTAGAEARRQSRDRQADDGPVASTRSASSAISSGSPPARADGASPSSIPPTT